VFRVSTRLLIIIGIFVGLVSLNGLSGIPAFATDASVTVNPMFDHVTVTPPDPSVPTTTPTYQFNAMASYTNAPDAIVTDNTTWDSTNNTVATINEYGLATIIAEGSTIICVEYRGQTSNTTLTVTAGTTPPPGGGGGGGGGGAPSSPGTVTFLNEYMNDEGLILVDAAAASEDGQVTVYLPEGTTARNKYNQPLLAVTIKEYPEPPDPPADCQFLCLTYDIGPNGATFDPPTFLIFSYSDAQVPEGVSEENMVVATLQDGEWVELTGGIVDTVDNIITVPISHLSVFTVLAYTSPAHFEVADLTVNPHDILPYETITVNATIINTGDLTGSFEAILTINNEVVRNQIKTLKGGSSETIVFTIVADTVGEHRVSLGNKVATFIVKEPPAPAAFEVSELKINPISVNSGDKVHISVLISNIGDLAGTYPIILNADDEIIETREITLDGGGSMTLSFSFSTDTVGEHTVNIDDLQGLFEVKSSSPPLVPELPDLELKNFSTTPDYDETTNTLVSVKIEYQMNQAWTSEPDARLMMTVLHNGELLEQIPLFTMGQLMDDGKTGELNYIPSAGWIAGEYTFQVELYDDDNILQDTLSHSLVVTPEAIIKVVSLWKLGAAIGITIILNIVLLAVIVYRRRDMLKNKVKIIRYIKILR
jgi:hypothetical protein